MASMLAPINHVRLDSEGRAWIDDTSYKVLDVVLDHLAYGWSPEEIHLNHYSVPSLAQIYAALAYYFDHQVEMDAQIRQQVKDMERLRAEAGKSPFQRRMRSEGCR